MGWLYSTLCLFDPPKPFLSHPADQAAHPSPNPDGPWVPGIVQSIDFRPQVTRTVECIPLYPRTHLRNHGYRGSGLSMAFSMAIVKAHGGFETCRCSVSKLSTSRRDSLGSSDRSKELIMDGGLDSHLFAITVSGLAIGFLSMISWIAG